MITVNISFGSKTIIETLQDEKSKLVKEKNQLGYKNSVKEIDNFIENISQNQKLSKTKIVRKIAAGSSAIVYETEDGDVLKLTRRSHYPLFRPQEDFDVPIKESGKAGEVHYYIEEKLFQHNLHSGFAKEIQEKIKNKGYKVYDFGSYGIHQIGMSKDGKIYLLDPECARYKTIFHALWNKLKNFFHKI